ncbi:hypothetical protein ISS37_11250 [candidate division KSB1 bacterium]|nr:hypothetical protein [candidate division KSB1 bacterium]
MKLKNIGLLVLMILTFLMSCQGERYVIKRDLASYTGRSEIIPLKAGLYLSDKTKAYMMPVGVGINKALLGEAIESEAVASLGKVFSSVSLFIDKNKAPQDIDRIITIEFGQKTDIELRTTKIFPLAVKEWSSTTELVYKLYDKNWSVLTEGSSVGQYSKEIGYRGGGGGAMGGFQAGSAGKFELIESVRGSLVYALEKMNDQILSASK